MTKETLFTMNTAFQTLRERLFSAVTVSISSSSETLSMYAPLQQEIIIPSLHTERWHLIQLTRTILK